MSNLLTCIGKAGKAISGAQARELLARSRELEDGGLTRAVADASAVREWLALIDEQLASIESQDGKPGATRATEQTARSVEGGKIDSEWTAFAPESGTLGIPREEMPQVHSEDRGALTQFLKGRGIEHTQEEVLPGTLKPTQKEFSEAKVDKARKFAGENRAILVSADNHVVDGHHQYVAALKDAPQSAYRIIRFNAPIRQLVELVKEFPSATTAKGQKTAGPAAAVKPELEVPNFNRKPPTEEKSDANRKTTNVSKEAGEKAGGQDARLGEADRAEEKEVLNRQAVADRYGLPVAQVGKSETVTHRGTSYRAAYAVVESGTLVTSNEPDGTVRKDYPKELQPRDRSDALYREQQRKIAANPNAAEEAIQGVPDRGVPTVVEIGGKRVVLIGNGRQNANELRYASEDFAEQARQYRETVQQLAAERGIGADAAAGKQPVLVRLMVDELPAAELKKLSQESNQFAGAATNAVEQARVDAGRMTPDILAFFERGYDVGAAKNLSFRQEFMRRVIGRAENVTDKDLERRIEAALFARAYGDTEEGRAAFGRLANENDAGVRNVLGAMMDVAPDMALMRQRMKDGTLHPLDLAREISRAVQEIAVALRDKPAKQTVDTALDGLLGQGELAGVGGRSGAEQEILRHLVASRRNRGELARVLGNYVSLVYAAGDPRQDDMFAASDKRVAPAVEFFKAAQKSDRDERLASGRAEAATELGRVLASGTGDTGSDLEGLVAVLGQVHALATTQRNGFLSDVITAARRAGVTALADGFRHALKRAETAVNKLARLREVPSDLLRASVISQAKTPGGVRADMVKLVTAMAREGYALYAPGGRPDVNDRHDGTPDGYKDIALKFVKDPASPEASRSAAGKPDVVVKEVLVLQPAMARAKARLHDFYDRQRAIEARLASGTLNAADQAAYARKAWHYAQKIALLGRQAYLADNPALARSSEEVSRSRPAFSSGERSLASSRRSSSGIPSSESTDSASSLEAFSAKDRRSSTERAFAVITPTPTAGRANRQRELRSGQEDFFDLLGAAPAADAYSRMLPPKTTASAEAFKAEVKKDLPQIPDAALDDLFQRAKSTQLADGQAAAKAQASSIVGDEVVKILRGQSRYKGEFTWQKLFSISDDAFGGTQAEGKYTVKDAYDALELGINRYIRSFTTSGGAVNFNPEFVSQSEAIRQIGFLKELLAKVPTQTKRTAEMDEFQQFSTVPPLAYVANWAANIKSGETYLEPSAGVGGLAVFGLNAGAKVYANELSGRRAALLRELGGWAGVFEENAEQLNNVLPADVRPTVVVMNPPFSSTAGRMQGVRDTANAGQHIEQALKRLAPGGRLVAIVGDGMAADRPAFKAWWARIARDYDVRANIQVSGQEYAKYGTTWDNQLVVIDKPGESTWSGTGRNAILSPVSRFTNPPLTGRVELVEELIPLLEKIRNERPEISPDLSTAAGNRGPAQPAGGNRRRAPGGAERAARTAGPAADLGDTGGGGGAGAEQRGVDATAGGRGERVAGGGDREGLAGRPGAGAAGDGQLRGLGAPAGGDEAALRRGPGAERLTVERRAAEASKGELTDKTFENYQPRITVPGATMPPVKLDESAAMASVEPPVPTYQPALPRHLIVPEAGQKEGRLSAVALESIILAGSAHQTMVPAVYTDEERTAHEKLHGRPPPAQFRRGFFIGDGTGAGKGRQAAGIIHDNWLQGRRKAVWVSEKSGLFRDARRDARDAAGFEDKVFEVRKVKPGERIGHSEGVAFVSYSTLRSTEQKPEPGKLPRTRLDQLVEWLGPEFDGVVAFDESHNMANNTASKVARGKRDASAQAIAGIELQRRLPNARVVYLSATGATEVQNLGYAERLGLWGPGTPFANKSEFTAQIDAGGVAAMELVARDMKAMGLYVARALSWDGVSYDRLDHALSGEQRGDYDALAGAWQVVLQNMEKALEVVGAVGQDPETGKMTTKNSDAKSAMRSAFWGTHQRFFNQVITSIKMPSVLKAIEGHLTGEQSVVVQLVNTNEASMERALSKRAGEEDADLDELDMSPRDQLIQMVEHSFPVIQQEEYTDENDNVKSRPARNSKGEVVLNTEAVAMREALIDRLANIRVPDGPLEILLNHFGKDAVAEVTGRTRRVVYAPGKEGGQERQVEKRGLSARDTEAQDFMDGKRRILVFSNAGGTGRSYHADLKAGNKQRRVHILLQPGWRADQAIQGLGRSHRNNQASAPHFQLAATDVAGEKRFISSIARRLDQLGALTKGERKTGSQGLFTARDNLESQQARDALGQLYTDVLAGAVEGVTPADFTDQMGLKLLDAEGNRLQETPPITQFLNRMLSLKLGLQDKVFEAFSHRLDRVIEFAIARGTMDQGTENVKALKTEVAEERVLNKDGRTGAETNYVKLKLTQATRRMPWEGIVRPAEQKFFQNETSGRVWMIDRSSNRTTADGRILTEHRLQGAHGTQYANEMELKGGHWRQISPETAETLWKKQYEDAPKTRTEDMHLITGTLLNVWDRLPEDQPRVMRAQTADGRRFLGREIRPGRLVETLANFDIKTDFAADPQALFDQLLGEGATAKLANGWRLKRSRVSGEWRVELTGPSHSNNAEMETAGVKRERIEYTMRYFIPTEGGAKALGQVIASRPVAELNGRALKSGRAQPDPGMDEAGYGDRLQLVRGNLGLADQIANSFRVPGQAADDLRQEARRALMKAAQKFDPAKGAFRPYAGQVVRNHLRDMFVNDVRRARAEVSLDAPNRDGVTLADTAGTAETTRRAAESEETNRLIREVVATLPEKPSGMIEEFMDGRTFREIAGSRAMSPQNAQKVVANGLKLIRARLRRLGVQGAEGGILYSGAEAPVAANEGHPLGSRVALNMKPARSGEIVSEVVRPKIGSAYQTVKLDNGNWVNFPLGMMSAQTDTKDPGSLNSGSELAGAEILYSGAENRLSESSRAGSEERAKIAQNYVEETKIPPAERQNALDDIDNILRTAGEEQLELHGYQTVNHGYGADTNTEPPDRKRRGKVADVNAAGALQGKAITDPTNTEALKAAFGTSDRISSIIPEMVRDPGKGWDIRGAVIKTPRDLLTFTAMIRSPYAETMKVVFIDSASKVVHSAILTIGTTTSSLAHPSLLARELQKAGKALSTRRVIFSHNHPSGDPAPSAADVQVTRQLRDAINSLGFELVDHVITNGDTYYSFREAGMIDNRTGKSAGRDRSKVVGEDVEQARPADIKAPWETARHSDLPAVNTETRLMEISTALKAVDPTALHVLYVNRKNRLLGIERVTGYLAEYQNQEKLNRRIFEGIGREGATAYLVAFPDAMPPAASVQAMRALKEFAKAADTELLDVSGPAWRTTARVEGMISEEKETFGRADRETDKLGPEVLEKRMVAAREAGEIQRYLALRKRWLTARYFDRFDGITGRPQQGQLLSGPADDEAEIARMMEELANDVPLDPFEELEARAQAEPEGQRTIGRPELANPAREEGARVFINAVDEARKSEAERESHEQWREEAERILAADREGVKRELLERARTGQGYDDPVMVKAAQILVADTVSQAVATRDPEAMREAQVLAWSYREGGTETARSLAARRDPFKRPADRHKEFLAGLMFTPPPALRAQLRETWSPAEKSRMIGDLQKRIAGLEAAQLAPPAGQTPASIDRDLTRMRLELARAIQTKDRLELLNSALNERMKKIEGELTKMGVTLDDIFGGEAYLRLRGARIIGATADRAGYDATKKRVLKLIQNGWGNVEIARRTGLTENQVAAIEDDFVQKLGERLDRLGDAALDVKKFDGAALLAGEASASIPLSAAERAKRKAEIIRAMGFGRADERANRTRRVRRVNASNKPQDARPMPQVNVDFDRIAAERARGSQQEAGEPNPAEAGAAPVAPGTGQPDTTGGDRQLVLGQDPDAMPPVFDLDDPVQVAQAARAIGAVDSNAFDMVYEFWVNSILSGPLTQGANILGNTANAVWDYTFKRLGETALNAMFVKSADAPQRGEFRHMQAALMPAMNRAWRNALRTWTAERSLFYQDALDAQVEIGEFDKAGGVRAAIPGRTGQIVRIPGRALVATDDFFKSLIANVEVAAQAYRLAKAEGLGGDRMEARMRGLINTPGSPAWTAAVRKAEELTFQEAHEGEASGRVLKALQQLRETDLGAGVKPLRFVLPFIRTPWNIFQQGFRQSPAGLALLLGRFARAGFYRLKDGRPMGQTYPAPMAVKHTVEQLMAWTAVALLYGAAAGDDDDEDKPILLTGAVPAGTAGLRELNQRTGTTNYTLRIGQAQFGYGRIEPLATVLGVTADTIRAFKESRRDQEGFDAIGALMEAVAAQAEEKTFLRGIGDIFSAINETRKGERVNYAANFAAGFVPNIIRQPLRQLDPYIRQSRRGGFAEQVATSVVTPAAERAVDVHGAEVQRPGLAGWRVFVPIIARRAPEINRVDRMLVNWAQAQPDKAWAPAPVGRTVKVNGQTRALTGPEQHDYAVESGRMAAAMLRHAALDTEHPTETDVERVQRAFTSARTIVRRQMFGAKAEFSSN